MLTYEKRYDKPASNRVVLQRVGRNFLIGLLLIGASVVLGMFGYRFFTHMTWVDAFMNASMILSGMGPVNPLDNDAAKIFAGFYALFSGIVFLAIIALILAPVFHSVFHRFVFNDKK